MAAARTLASRIAKPRGSPRIEYQTRVDRHGTPCLWLKEEGRPPVLLSGAVVRQLSEDLADLVSSAARSAAGHSSTSERLESTKQAS